MCCFEMFFNLIIRTNAQNLTNYFIRMPGQKRFSFLGYDSMKKNYEKC